MKIKHHFVLFLFFSPLFLIAQNELTIQMSNGEVVELHPDRLFFADAIPEQQQKIRRGHFQRHPRNMLGAPKIVKGSGWPNNKVTSLGCRGRVTIMFKEKGLVDGPGPDLLIFEEGKFMEATLVEISTDGTTWINVGIAEGGKSTVDIAQEATKDKIFHYVRFKDLGTRCDRVPNDGADINAVAALYTEDYLEEQIFFSNSDDVDKKETINDVSNNLPTTEIPALKTPHIELDFTIFPNPTNDELNLKFDLEKESQVSARIFNQQGKQVKVILQKEQKEQGSQIIQYSLGDLPAGTYYVQLLINGHGIVKKLIKHTK